MFSKSTFSFPSTLSANTFVIAAVKVVLPWSNLALAILTSSFYRRLSPVRERQIFIIFARLITIILHLQHIFKPILKYFRI